MQRFALGILLTALAATAQPVFAADSFPINVYPCSQASSAPVIDGRLDDAVWQHAPLVSGFTNYENGAPLEPQTYFRVLWDEKALYFAVRCDEPRMADLTPVVHSHDEHAIFGAEAVEVFVDPDHNHSRYYQIAYSVGGSVYDGEGVSTAWDSKAQLKTSLQPDGWSAELALPWEPLKARPVPGKVLGFNVSRDRRLAETQYTSWARVDSNLGFHDPERFGHLVLSGTPEMIGRMFPEFRKGGRTGPLNVFSAEGFAGTTYTQLAAAAFAQVEKRLSDLERARKSEANAGTSREIRRRLREHQAQLTALKADSAAGLDAAGWIRLEFTLQRLMTTLDRTIADARLKALLDRI